MGFKCLSTSAIHVSGRMLIISDDLAALEAAHIRAHSEEQNYRTANGILLRADIHTLFDLRLISVNPQTGKLVVSSSLGSTYQQYAGQIIRLPSSPHDYPDPAALMEHYAAWVTAEQSDS